MKDLAYFQNLYIQTAYDYLNKINNEITALSDNPHNQESITNLRIAAHSLKSQSYAMNYQQTANLSLILENIFTSVKEDKISISPGLLNAIKKSADKLTQSIDAIKNNNKEIDLSEDINFLNKIFLHL